MSPLVEAFVLPVLFLTVTLTASLRPGAGVTMVPPSPASLVAATLLFAILVRSGGCAPNRLMNSARHLLANVNGLTVLVSAFIASAAVITLVVPESGLPALIVWAVLLSLLLQATAMGADRQSVLRGLLVTFGAAFTLKFVILAAASAPAQSRVGRALQALFEGITFGAVSQRPTHALEPYLAFGAIALYLIGIALLPSATWFLVRTEESLVRRTDRTAMADPPKAIGRYDIRDEGE